MLGFIDGILTALTLTAGRLLEPGATADYGLALRVAIASFASGIFVFFVAKYAELRGKLLRQGRELNLASSKKLINTVLGRKILVSSFVDAAISGVAGFVGAYFPLLIAAIIPTLPWFTFSISLAILGVVGFILGREVGKRPILWIIGLLAGGIIITAIGVELHIVD